MCLKGIVWIITAAFFSLKDHTGDFMTVCDLTNRTVDGDVGALGVSVVRHGEHTGVAARVLRVFGVHQAQGAVSERDPEAVQLHVAVPGQRGDTFPRLAVEGEDV